MKNQATLLLLVALIGLASTSAVKSKDCGCQEGFCYDRELCDRQSVAGPPLHKVRYNWEPIEDRDERCLCNEFNQQGRKVILVNLDNNCLISRLEREGIFLETGDLIIVVGSALAGSGQEWRIPDNSLLNPDIVVIIDDYEIVDYIDCDVSEFTYTLEAIRSGKTRFDVNLYWNCELLNAVSIDIYVNQQPCLCSTCPRACIDDCYSDETYDHCDPWCI